ncbi:IPExxxVDY family protein [Hanstruepera neustonica]|uniref:IPExxxVDY family protein n=1 Tax=Hanstruepera neustonica TaxID=1445657 RepID=A0A2K1E3N6_9FLAO|nr:IPExxxVDY family protein [Hanstruepera neustonica]PNQ74883.1 IPExxxVDY family protein [Hanstruepera neustonica]
MAVQKLVLDDFLDIHDYGLIGIHCSIEDYRLAYFLNQYLNINLSRKSQDLDFSKQVQYPIFEWEDEKKQIIWNLVSNSCKVESQTINQTESLFSNPQATTKTHYLISEYKKVNYFLKISEEDINKTKLKLVLNKILSIPQIVTAYNVNPEELKSRNNLIFY